jgi:hypothetical protein
VYELCEDRIAPDRIVLSVEINSGHTPLGKPLPANLVVARRTARLTCWLGDPWWCRPVYVEDRP